MTATETDEMMHGLELAVTMCRENRNGCNSCPFHGTHIGCMFQSKRYPARWNLGAMQETVDFSRSK